MDFLSFIYLNLRCTFPRLQDLFFALWTQRTLGEFLHPLVPRVEVVRTLEVREKMIIIIFVVKLSSSFP